eukprot:10998411-Prorocentrum_lima.AAC.1
MVREAIPSKAGCSAAGQLEWAGQEVQRSSRGGPVRASLAVGARLCCWPLRCVGPPVSVGVHCRS